MEKKKFPSYEEAQKIVSENDIKNWGEYMASYKKLGLPSAPNLTYKSSGWTSWPDFLGTSFPPYEEAQKIVSENDIKNSGEYRASYKKLGLPSAPDQTYKNSGWTSWPDFLGKSTKNFPPYEDAQKIVSEKGIKSQDEYKSSYKKLGLPSAPNLTYKNSGWTSWPDFLGTSFPPYEEAQKIVSENDIKNSGEYRASYKKLGLPSTPDQTYKNSGWTGWSDFLDTSFPPYEEAQKIVSENDIKNWGEYRASYKKLGLPSHPEVHYKNSGWTGWSDFLDIRRQMTAQEKTKKFLSPFLENPLLLNDAKSAPLQVIYMLATYTDVALAKKIEENLLHSTYEERLRWIKEQLKEVVADETSVSLSSSASMGERDELSTMGSALKALESLMEGLPSETTDYMKAIWENYSHNAVNRALIKEYDG